MRLTIMRGGESGISSQCKSYQRTMKRAGESIENIAEKRLT